MIGQGRKAPGGGRPQDGSAPAKKNGKAKAAGGGSKAETRLMARVYQRCHEAIEAACAQSSVPPEFLAALVANESGGNPKAARFEPLVYRHLRAPALPYMPCRVSL